MPLPTPPPCCNRDTVFSDPCQAITDGLLTIDTAPSYGITPGEFAVLTATCNISGGGGGGGDITIPTANLIAQVASTTNWLTAASTVIAAGATSVAVAISSDFTGDIAGGTIDPTKGVFSYSYEARAGGKLGAITVNRSAGSYQISKVV